MVVVQDVHTAQWGAHTTTCTTWSRLWLISVFLFPWLTGHLVGEEREEVVGSLLEENVIVSLVGQVGVIVVPQNSQSVD